MSTISKPHTIQNGNVADGGEVEANFATIYNDYNGNITNANISGSAAIDSSKLNLASVAITGGTITGITDLQMTGPIVNVKAYGATGDGATDDTTAITNALATKKSVFFPAGTYITQGGHSTNHEGQHIIGAGAMGTASESGVKIKRKAGTSATLLTVIDQNNCISGITFDGSSLEGNLLEAQAAFQFTVEKCRFMAVGGTATAINLNLANIGWYRNLSFGDGNYCNIRNTTAYSYNQVFENIVMGNINSSGHHLYIKNANNWTIKGLTIDHDSSPGKSIHIDSSESINFYGLYIEGQSTEDWVSIESANCLNIGFYGLRTLHYSNVTTNSVFNINGAKNVVIDGWYIEDLISGTSRDIISMNGVSGFSLNNVDAYVASSFNLINMVSATTKGSHYNINQIQAHSGAAGYMRIWANYVSVNNSNMGVTFASSGTSENITCTEVSGLITVNSNYATSMTVIDCPSITDPHNVTMRLNYGRIAYPIKVLANDSTASVVAGGVFLVSGATSYTNFTGGVIGQQITLLSESTPILIDGTNILLSGSTDFQMASSDTITLIRKADSKWYELNRSVNG